MSTAKTSVRVEDQPAGPTRIVLANGVLEVVVLPQLGGRVWEITHVSSGRQLLWHNRGLRPAPVEAGADYDDNFIGGWDELFPNDIPERLAGIDFPDHGESWSAPWVWMLLADGVELRLTGPCSGSRLVRRLRLPSGSSTVLLDVEATNAGDAPLPMLHKQHLAADLPPGSRVDLPPARVELGDFGPVRAGRPGDEFDWPLLATPDGTADFSDPPPDGTAEFWFATGLAEGWIACTRPDGLGVGLAFDLTAYPSCWLFASWGGWRDHRVAVLEPCTGSGLSVAEGAAVGRHRVLAPGETIRTRVSAVVYEGLAEVTGIAVAADGTCVVTGVHR